MGIYRYSGSRSPPRRKYDDELGYDGREEYQTSLPTNLYVHNISYTTRVEDLRVLFQGFGTVQNLYLPKNHETGEHRGFGFVNYHRPEDAAEAMHKLNHQTIEGRGIRIEYAKEQRKIPQDMQTTPRLSGRNGGGYRRSPPRSSRRQHNSHSPPPRHESRDLNRVEVNYSPQRPISRSPSSLKLTKRKKKGRGFSQRYAFVQKYHSPFQERMSPKSYFPRRYATPEPSPFRAQESIPLKSKHSSQAEENQSPLVIGKHAPVALSKNGVASDVVEQDREPPRENGNLRINGVETETPRSNKSTERKPDLVDDDPPGKSRSPSISPKKAMSKSMSISPPRRHGPRCLTPRSPERVLRQSRRISRSPERAKSISSRSSRSRSRSIVSRSPRRGPSRVSRSPVKSVSRRSGSKSSLRSARRKTPVSRSPRPVKRKRSISRSPVRKSLRRRSVTRSPLRRRRSYSQKPISPPPVRKGRSSPNPSSQGRSVSRSVSPDGSPKRVRKGRGFNHRYSYGRRNRTPTPDRSFRYGGRTDRSYADRSSRHYRSPPSGRTPPSRYKSRRSWSRSLSASRSPPIRSRRSPVEKSRSRGSLKSEKRRKIREHQ